MYFRKIWLREEKILRFNWPIWVGFLLAVVAGFSYTTVFVWYPITRDFPWANFLLYAIALVFLAIGVRRAFAPGRRLGAKILASVLATLSVAMLSLFIFGTMVFTRWLPASEGAPRVGQTAPDFTLADTSSREVSLSELLSTPIKTSAGGEINPKAILLVFYRGYW